MTLGLATSYHNSSETSETLDGKRALPCPTSQCLHDWVHPMLEWGDRLHFLKALNKATMQTSKYPRGQRPRPLRGFTQLCSVFLLLQAFRPLWDPDKQLHQVVCGRKLRHVASCPFLETETFWLPLPCEVTVPSHHWKSQFLGWQVCSQVAPFPKALGWEVRS